MKFNMGKNSNKNILIYYFGYMTQDFVKPLHLFTNKIIGYIEEQNKN